MVSKTAFFDRNLLKPMSIIKDTAILRLICIAKRLFKGKSLKLTISILVSTLIYILILLRLTFLKPDVLFEIELPAALSTIGFALVSIGFVLGILALVAMKNSWRVGIKYDQKTELVTTGIYRFSRNPYFLSYGILIFGYILIFASPVLIILYVILVMVFHRMILEEEKYLLAVHGAVYEKYKRKVGRYLTIM